MKVENGLRVEDEQLHKELLTMSPWGDVRYNKFVGKIVFDDGIDGDVGVYLFNVVGLIDDFIGMYIKPSTGLLDKCGTKKAKILIKDLKFMIKLLKNRMPKEKD